MVLSFCAITKSSRQLQSAQFTRLFHKTFCSHNLAVSGGVQSGVTNLLLHTHALFFAVIKIKSSIIRPRDLRFSGISQTFLENLSRTSSKVKNSVFLKSPIERSAMDGGDYVV